MVDRLQEALDQEEFQDVAHLIEVLEEHGIETDSAEKAMFEFEHTCVRVYTPTESSWCLLWAVQQALDFRYPGRAPSAASLYAEYFRVVRHTPFLQTDLRKNKFKAKLFGQRYGGDPDGTADYKQGITAGSAHLG